MAYRIVKISSRCKLETQLNYLVCRTDKETRILLDEISVLLIENPQACITSALISELMSHKIRVIFCDSKHNPQGELEPYSSCSDSPAKLSRQIQWTQSLYDEIWQVIIRMKIDNQARCMARHDSKPDRIKMLETYGSDVTPGDPTNREGLAAKAYFSSIFGEGFDRRDEYDIKNTFLNYGYSLLLSLVNREISAYGYNNMIGIHHKGATNPFNLGCDLVEPLRPFVDDFILSHQVLAETFKKDMLPFITSEVMCNGRKMILQNAINSYVVSVIGALNAGDASKIYKVGFLDGGVAV